MFGPISKKRLATAHADLQTVFNAVMNESTEEEDFAITCSLRDEAAQAKAYAIGASHVEYPKSFHNGSIAPDETWDEEVSDAIDAVPYPIEWPDEFNDSPYEYVRKMARFYNLAVRILRKAEELGIEIKWGGTFKRFFDGPHYQRKR